MGRAKSIIILIGLATFLAGSGLCLEENPISGIDQTDRRLEKLQIYFETEMYEEAATLLTQLLADFPGEPRLEYLKAIVDYQRQDYDSAQQVFTEFITQYPDIAEPYYLLAEINLQQGNQEQAELYLAKYCELVPEDFAARSKLAAFTRQKAPFAIIMENGREDAQLVENIGFYGACLHAYQESSVKITNGSHCNWSSMGIDFIYPIDLRGKRILLKVKGKQGGERLQLTLRDKWASGYSPQLVLTPEEGAASFWQNMALIPEAPPEKIDLSQVVHLGLEFGFSTARNPAHSTLFVEDIIIEDANN
ncbi:MAG: tetratricopeptide repeat protein [Candidatus Omnitrophica bacterium]|nr:tetratricopeptide repeat protein [Candidatus Omnitrophota bacterium]